MYLHLYVRPKTTAIIGSLRFRLHTLDTNIVLLARAKHYARTVYGVRPTSSRASSTLQSLLPSPQSDSFLKYFAYLFQMNAVSYIAWVCVWVYTWSPACIMPDPTRKCVCTGFLVRELSIACVLLRVGEIRTKGTFCISQMCVCAG